MNEADTCRTYVIPKLQAAGWESSPHRINEQVTFTDGRIIAAGARTRRGPQKRADYLLRYARDYTIAVVEAKADYKTPSDGLQQAKLYAVMLGLKFAFATNGHSIVFMHRPGSTQRRANACCGVACHFRTRQRIKPWNKFQAEN